MKSLRTLGDLRRGEYRILPVREEMRKNLIRKLKENEPLFPGIIGYDASVIPQVENAILSGQDIVFLGERGQAKSRLIRGLVGLLDEVTPVVAGCALNDDPYAPVCKPCRQRLEAEGDALAIEWLPRDRRYGEKLATPDTSIADLIGEVDPVRVAEGKYLSDELTIHYGLVPRTNRGIFAINELPDLAERIQVGLLNIMEERDVQIRGYKIRLSLDVVVVASANPEDYTNRGRIITPLKDRFGAQIRTHYPRTVEHEMKIVEQERMTFNDAEPKVIVPDFIREIVAEITHVARRNPKINQRSGVSVRLSIGNLETLLSNALRRALRTGETEVAPRISDLGAIVSSSAGKLELETWEEGDDAAVFEKVVRTAVLNVFRRHFEVSQFTELVKRFDAGFTLEAGEMMPSTAYVEVAGDLPNLEPALKELGCGKRAAALASAVEFILEGLHLSKRINKSEVDGGSVYGS
jgi:magnesium chelatase subunit I